MNSSILKYYKSNKTRLGIAPISWLLCLFAVLFIGFSPVAAEDLSTWNHVQTVYLNTTASGANVSSDVSNIPILVRLTASNIDFSEFLASGNDIRFTQLDTTNLTFESERWDNGSDLAEYWVLMPTVPGDSIHKILMWWGKAGAADSSNSNAVFSSSNGFVGVWHLNDNFEDATSNNNDGTNNGSSDIGAIIADGQDFDGNNDYIVIDNSSGSGHSLDHTEGPFTLSLWFNADAMNGTLLAKRDNNDDQYHFFLETSGDDYLFFRDENDVGRSDYSISAGTNTWYHGVIVVDASENPEIYINGAIRTWVDALGSRPFSFPHRDVDVTIGARWSGAPAVDKVFDGKIDEVRVSTTDRSADWIKLCYENQQAIQALVDFDDAPIAGSGNALQFDGSNDYVDCGSMAGLNITDVITIEAWVNPASSGISPYILAKRDGSQQQYGFCLLDGIVEFATWGSNSAIRTSETVPEDQWTHVAAVFNSSTQTGEIYINGVAKATDNTATAITAATSDVFIGARGNGSGGSTYNWDGLLDEVRVWHEVRTQTEIQDNMHTALLGNETNLVGYWRMDKSSGTLLPDYTSSESHGELKNMDDADWVASDAWKERTTNDETALTHSAGWEPDGTAVTLSEITAPSQGSLSFNNGNRTVTYTPTQGQVGTFTYTYQISDGSNTDTYDMSVSVSDNDPVVISYSPADNADDVLVHENLVLTFDEPVDAETGNIVIKRSSDDAVFETIDVTSGQVTGSGTTTITIDPSSDFNVDGYYVQISAIAFDDADGVSYTGISDKATWNFTTVSSDTWGITSSTFNSASDVDNIRVGGGTSPNVDNMVVTRLNYRSNGTGTVAMALYTGGNLADPTDATRISEVHNVAVSAGWNAIDIPNRTWPKNTVTWIAFAKGGNADLYYSENSADCGNFQSVRGRWSVSAPSNYDETTALPVSIGAGSFGDTWYAMHAEYIVFSGNNAPTDISLSASSVDENQSAGTYVCKLTAADADPDDHVYYLMSGSGDSNNTSFTISNDTLYTNDMFDYETQSSYGCRIQVDDCRGGLYSEAVTITVTNVNEDPVAGSGNALQFDGVDEYVELADGCMVTAAFTLEFWVKSNSPDNYERIFVQGPDACGSRGLMVYWLSNQLEVRTGTTAGDGSPDAAAALPDGVWSHVAWIFDGSDHTMYFNGDTSGTATVGPSDMTLSGSNYIGCRDLNNYWTGGLDEIRLWSDVRTHAEIQDNMHTALAGNESDLAGYWRFDESSGTSFLDHASGGGYNGTLQNMETGDWIASEAWKERATDDQTALTHSAGWDPDGDAVTLSEITAPSQGSLSFNNGNRTVTYTPTQGQLGTFTYTYQISDGPRTDTYDMSVYVSDYEPVVISYNPADDATFVLLDENLVLTFDESVDAETGNIVIKRSADDAVFETIDVTSGQVTGSGTAAITIDPSSNFNVDGYYVQIDATAFDDADGISYAGISDKTTWNFATVSSDTWGITSSAFTSNATENSIRCMGGTSPDQDNMVITKLNYRSEGSGTIAIALYTGGSLNNPTGAIRRAEAHNVSVSAGWNEIDVSDRSWPKNTPTWIAYARGTGANSYYSNNSSDRGDFQSAEGRWTVTSPSDYDETTALPDTIGPGSFSGAWYAMHAAYATISTNNAPTDISLSPSSVDENQSAGTFVCKLTATDADPDDHVYYLMSGSGDSNNTSFTISNDTLFTNAVFDYETQSSYGCRIQVDDCHGGLYDEAVTVTVNSVNEDPVAGSGNALEFDADNDCVTIPVGTLGTYTVSFWIYPTNPDSWGGLIGNDNTNSIAIRNGGAGGDAWKIDYWSGASNYNNTPLTPNAWNHVAITKTGSSVTFYLNGVSDGTATISIALIFDIIGRNQSADEFFGGYLDEVRIWDVVRSESDIADDMYTALTGGESNLIAYYRADASSGTTLKDYSGSGYHGTLTNMTDADWIASEAWKNRATNDDTPLTHGAGWDIDGDGLTITQTVAPAQGSLSFNDGNKTVTYTPEVNSESVFTYTYQVSDGFLIDTYDMSVTVTDVTGPAVSTYSPPDEEDQVVLNADFALTFNENVQAGTGNITLYKSDDTQIEAMDVTGPRVTFNGTTGVTINPTNDLLDVTGYYVKIDNGAVKDQSAGQNAYSGIADKTTWNFTTADLTAPTAQTYSPADEATAVAVDADLVITFDEVVDAETGNISLYKTVGDVLVQAFDVTTDIAGSGTTTITCDPTADLESETDYYVQIDVTAFDDPSGNSYAGIADKTTWNFTSADALNPIVSTFSPADDITAVAFDANLVITFNEVVDAESGNINLYKTDGDVLVQAFNVTTDITGSGTTTITADPTDGLENKTEYYVKIDVTAFDDPSDNSYAGITDETTWNFCSEDTTAPDNDMTLTATAISSTDVEFSWNPSVIDSTDADSVALVYKYSDYADSVDDPDANGVIKNPLSTLKDTLSSLESGLIFYANLFVRDTSGNWSDSAISSSDTALTFPQSTLPFSDDFETGTGQVGAWDTLNVNSSTAAQSGSRSARISGAGHIRKAFNMSDYSDGSVKLKWYWYGISNEAADDSIFLDIYDGSWNQGVKKFGGDLAWTQDSLDMSAYNLSNIIHILFRAEGTAADDKHNIDNVVISGSKKPELFDTSGVTTTLTAIQRIDGSDTIDLYYQLQDDDSNDTISTEYRQGAGAWSSIENMLGDSGAVSAADSSVHRKIRWYAATQLTDVEASDYQIRIFAKDEDGNRDTLTMASANLLVDTKAPTQTDLSPDDDSTEVPVDKNPVIIFHENVFAQSGSIELRKTAGDVLVQSFDVTSQISGSGTNTITIDPGASLESEVEYYVTIPATAFDDGHGNSFAGITTTTGWSFTAADVAGPVVSTFSPADEATAVAVDADLVITFDEVVDAESGNVSLYKTTGDVLVQAFNVTTDITGSGTTTITCNPTADLESETDYYVQIDATAFDDPFGNSYAGINDKTTWNFTSADVVNPQVSTFSPADEASAVAVDADLVITFDEVVDAESGNISLYKTVGDVLVQAFDVTTDIAGSGTTTITCNSTADLESETGYYVQIDATAFDDPSGNSYGGIADKTTWNFTSADVANPTVSTFSPADEATAVAVDADLIITFNEVVDAESGNINLYKTTGDVLVQAFDVTTDIAGSGTATITCNTTADLESETDYYVQIDAAAFDDPSGNSYAGIADKTTWNFTSADVVNPTVSTLSPTDGATAVVVDADLVITFDEIVDAESGNISLYKTTGDVLVQAFDVTTDIAGSGTTTITCDPTADLDSETDYYVQIDVTAFDDPSGNSYAGIADKTTWNFTSADVVNPTVSTFSPADEATAVAIDADLVITFDELVDAESGNISLFKTSGDVLVQAFDVTTDITGSGTTTITCNTTADLESETDYYVQIDATAFDDPSGNSYAGITDKTTWNFTSADVANPIVSTFGPADDATEVPGNVNLVITFDEVVDAESGNINLYKTVGDILVQAFDVTTDIAGSGTATITCDPTADLESETDYYVQIDVTAFDDPYGNSYAGITDKTTWNFTSADAENPIVSTLNPADNATGVVIGSDLVITFNEVVDAESGNINLYKTVGDVLVQAFDVTTDITGSGTTTITCDPTADFESETDYYVQIDATAFDDLLGNSYLGISDKITWNFTSEDVVNPTVSTLSPADEAAAVAVDMDLVITFDEVVDAESGNVSLYKTTGDVLVQAFDVTTDIAGSGTTTITCDPTADLESETDYYVQIDVTAFDDPSGNSYAGITDKTTWNFTSADVVNPTVSTYSPADGATAVVIDADLVITFDEIVDAESGNISLYKTVGDVLVQAFDVTTDIAGTGTTTITCNPAADLESETDYYVQIDATAFDDPSGNSYAGIADKTTWNFTSADVINPTVSTLSPTDGATAVAIDADLVIIFDEIVDAESGNISLYKTVGDVLVQAFDVTTDIAGTGTTTITCNTTADLESETDYYVQIDATAFDDPSGNSYAGITDKITWNFTSADVINPTVSTYSPADGATAVVVDADLVITFDEIVDAESGNISLYKTVGDVLVQAFDVTTDIAGTGTTTITCDPTADLESETDYYVQIDATAFDDPSGNSYAGIADKTTWNFTSADVVNPTVSTLSPTDGATAVAIDADLVITFDEIVDAESGNISLYKTVGDVLVQAFDVTTDIAGTGTTTITCNTTADLESETDYYVQIDATAFDDPSGNSYAGITDKITWNFTSADVINPTVSTLSPADGAAAVVVDANLVITFDEVVDAETGNISLYKTVGDVLVQAFDVTTDIAGSGTTTITCDPTADLESETDYYVQIDVTAFDDPSGNSFAGITDKTTWNFTSADVVNPTVSTLSPTDGATAVTVDANLVITFNEAVDAETGNISLYKTVGDVLVQAFEVTTDIAGSGTTTITCDPTADLESETEYYVQIDATAFDDPSGNSYSGITDKTTWNFTSADVLNPTVSTLSPADGATAVSVDANLIITFDEVVDAETGSISLYKTVGDVLVQAFDVTADITGTGTTTITCNPTADLESETDYYVQIDATAFDDPSGNSYAGIADKTTWNFSSADVVNPTVSTFSPADEATAVSVDADLVITFDEMVDAETGSISLYKTVGDVLVQAFDVTTDITGSGTATITCNPTADLESETDYYVQIDATAFDDPSGNSYAGIADKTTWNFTSADVVNPTVSTFSPADEATAVAVDANLVITFDEVVDTETGNISLYKTVGDVLVQAFDVATDITGSGTTTITCNPAADLESETDYYVQIDATAFDDPSGNSYAGIADKTTWNFTSADVANPTVSTFSPADEAAAVAVDANLVITFNEVVDAETGNISLYKTVSDVLVQAFDLMTDITGSGTTTITCNPAADLESETGYYVQIDATAFDDPSGNSYAGIADKTTWNFTTEDNTAPTVQTYSPADDAVNVVVNTNLILTFNENVQAGTGNITLYKSDDSQVEQMNVTGPRVSFNGTTGVTIDPTNDLDDLTGFYVQIDAGAIKDQSSNQSPYAGINDKTTWNFTTNDITPPQVVTYSPADDATVVAVGTGLELTFDENIQAGTGNITLYKSDDTQIEQMDVTGPRITFNGTTGVTINLTNDLDEQTSYYVQIDNGSIKDQSSNQNAYAGIADKVTWNFTTGDFTAPTVITYDPADDAVSVPVDANLIVTFNENVQKGTGNIIIKLSSDDSVFETIDVTTVQVTVSGNQVTIDPSGDIASETGYYVQIAGTCIKDMGDNAYAGISDKTTWNFTSADIGAPTALTFSPADNTSDVAVDVNLIIKFSENIIKGTGNITIKRISGSSTFETIDVTTAQVTVSNDTAVIDPSSEFESETGYYIQIDNTCFEDNSSNKYAGISDSTTWDFSTGDVVSPTIASVTSASSDGSYGIGDTVIIVVNFSENVTLSGGSLEITLETGAVDRVAAIAPFGPANNVTTIYIVQEGDETSDLAALSPLVLTVGTLQDNAGNDAILAIPNGSNIADNKDIVVDGVRPANVTSLTGQALSIDKIALQWVSSTSADAESLMIRYRTDGNYPVDYSDGTLGAVLDAGITKDTLSGLAEDTEYRIAVFTKDSTGNWNAADDTARVAIKTITLAVARIEILPDTATVSSDSTKLFTVTGYNKYDEEVPVGAVSWSVVGAIGTIDSAGLFTAVKAGTGKIVASHQTINDTTNTINVVPGVIVTVSISPDTGTVKADTTVQFSVSVLDADGNSVAVNNSSWSFIGNSGSIDSTGLFIPNKVDTVKIIATADSRVDTTGDFIIVPGTLFSLEIMPDSSDTIQSGQTIQFSVSGTDAKGNITDPDTVIFGLTNAAVGDISPQGLFTARLSGETRVYASAQLYGISDTSEVIYTSGNLIQPNPDDFVVITENGVTLIFSPGAVDSPIVVSIAKINVRLPLQDSIEEYSSTYYIQPDDIVFKNTVIILMPVDSTITFEQAEKLKIFNYRIDNPVWDVIYNSVFEVAEGREKGTIYQFGYFMAGIDIQIPVVDYYALQQVNEGGTIRLSIDITDNIPTNKVTVYYKLGGEEEFRDTTMTVIGTVLGSNGTRAPKKTASPIKHGFNFARNIIPQSKGNAGKTFSGTVNINFQPTLATPRGLEYYIKGEDGTNIVTTQKASTGVLTQNISDKESIPLMQWRLISVPMQQKDNSFETLFTSLGNYDPSEWKAYAYENSNYVEIMNSDINSIESGKSYWLKIKDKDFTLVSGEALSAPTEKPYEITLKPGWNLISNPFVFDISWNVLRMLLDSMGLSDYVTGPYTYDGNSWRVPWPIGNIVSLKTWHGYAVKNETLKDIVFPVPASAYSERTAAKRRALPTENFWKVTIQARNGKEIVDNRVIGIHPEAKNEFDRYDYRKPPAIESKFSFCMEREWMGKATEYITDIREPFEEGETWDMSVSDAKGTVELAFDLSSPELDEHEIYLFDVYKCISQNLRKDSVYTFKANISRKRGFAVIVGTYEYVQEVINKLNVPKYFNLAYNYPNPFRHITRIKYQLKYEGKVSLKIFNMQGRTLVNLVNCIQKPGFYTVSWNGRDREGRGRNMASGVYFYQILVKDKNTNLKLYRKTKKMKLVR